MTSGSRGGTNNSASEACRDGMRRDGGHERVGGVRYVDRSDGLANEAGLDRIFGRRSATCSKAGRLARTRRLWVFVEELGRLVDPNNLGVFDDRSGEGHGPNRQQEQAVEEQTGGEEAGSGRLGDYPAAAVPCDEEHRREREDEQQRLPPDGRGRLPAARCPRPSRYELLP